MPNSNQQITVTVSGPVGSGKTAIIAEILRRLEDVGFNVEFANTDGDLLQRSPMFRERRLEAVLRRTPNVTIVESTLSRLDARYAASAA